MLRPVIVGPLMLLLIATSPVITYAQSATPGTADTINRHLGWVTELFDGDAAALTTSEIAAHFAPVFLDVVPTEEVIATFQQLERELGPIVLIEDRSADAGPGEFIGVFESASGERVMISFAVDPESGLIVGFFITPADARGTVASPPAATPAASPVPADTVVTDPESQIAQYQDQSGRIREIGEPMVDALLAGDDAALEPLLSPALTEAFSSMSAADVLAMFTTDQIQMSFEEAGAHFFGRWRDDTISGVMVQTAP